MADSYSSGDCAGLTPDFPFAFVVFPMKLSMYVYIIACLYETYKKNPLSFSHAIEQGVDDGGGYIAAALSAPGHNKGDIRLHN